MLCDEFIQHKQIYMGIISMNKIDKTLEVLQVLVESAGGSINPYWNILVKEADMIAEDEINQIKTLYDTAINGFFFCASQDVIFEDLSKIVDFYGSPLEHAYPGVSKTFMKLARTYWTFKVVLNECKPDSSVCFALLQEVDINFAGLFFPTPGVSPPKELREETMRTIIEQSGADLDIEDYIRGNFYLRGN